jgi:hypothetical protein
MLICFGVELQPPLEAPIPDYYNGSLLIKYLLYCTSWWDETHKDLVIGDPTASHVVFPRDEFGELDVENGTYDMSPPTETTVKFALQVRLALGIAVVQPRGGGDIKGVRAVPYDYSDCTLATRSTFKQEQATEMNNLKNQYKKEKKELAKRAAEDAAAATAGEAPTKRRKMTTSKWAIEKRLGRIFDGDTLDKLQGCTVSMAEKLSLKGIDSLADLKSLSPEVKSGLVRDVAALTLAKLDKFIAEAANALAGSCPLGGDHRTAENPYLSRYGTAEWEGQINTSTHMKKFKCVEDMIHRMVRESEALYVGTENEGKPFYFYHDSLSLMTCKETQDFMRVNGYLKHWILPQLGLNKSTAWANMPPGDCPELNGLDCSCNKTLHDEVKRHIAYTWNLAKDDPKKFSLATLKQGQSAYLRLFDPETGGAPSSERIVQDINKFIPNCEAIRANSGAIVYGLGNRYGVRYISGMKQHGGKRTKKTEFKTHFVHPDAIDARNKIAAGGKSN